MILLLLNFSYSWLAFLAFETAQYRLKIFDFGFIADLQLLSLRLLTLKPLSLQFQISCFFGTVQWFTSQILCFFYFMQVKHQNEDIVVYSTVLQKGKSSGSSSIQIYWNCSFQDSRLSKLELQPRKWYLNLLLTCMEMRLIQIQTS